jgi:hypothetical protein
LLLATGRSVAGRSATGRPRGRPSKHGAPSTIDPDRSFGEESHLFGTAGFDTSSINPSSDHEGYDDDLYENQGSSNLYKPLRGPSQQQQPLIPTPTQRQSYKPVAAQQKPVTPKKPVSPKKASPKVAHVDQARPLETSWDWRASFDHFCQYLKEWFFL